MPPAGDTLFVALRNTAGRPATLGWTYDRPGGSYNASGWDYVPIINFFTKGYRAICKKKLFYDGYVQFGTAMGIAQTGQYVTTIDQMRAANAYAGVQSSTKNWTQLYSNIIAHEQLHLGAYGGFDWLNAPPGHIASATGSTSSAFTVNYGNWVSKFLSEIDLN